MTDGDAPTVFTRIIRGDIPGTFVWRDAQCVAFLSINPIAFGHTLVVPIREVDHWIDCEEALAAHLFTVSHVIGRAQQAAFGCARVGLIVAGFEVPHTHVHVIPMNGMGDISFANAAARVSGEDLAAAADAIRAQLRLLSHPEVSD
jgi:histidine triad (HIT) family protein